MESDRKKIVVTGGAGYVGWYLCRFLLANNYEVLVLDSLLFGDVVVRNLASHTHFYFEHGDIRHIGDLARAFKDAYGIIHLAAVVGDPACGKNPEFARIVNVESTKAIVELANYYSVERLLFASSCSVYGAASSDVLLNEGSYLNPVSYYAESRIQSEKIILSETKTAAPTILRLATAYGYSLRMRFDLAVNIMTLNALTRHEVRVFGGNQYRPFVHCQDIGRAFLAVLEADEHVVKNEAFNVGSNEQNFKLVDLGTGIAQTLGVSMTQIQERDDDRNYRVDFSKIEWLLHYKAKRTISESVLEIRKHFENNEFENWEDARYYNVRYDYMM